MDWSIDSVKVGEFNLFESCKTEFGDLMYRIVRAAKPILNRQPVWFENFTDHGWKHSERIAQQLNQWLGIRKYPPFESLEACILLGSIFLHDIGMECECPDLLRGITKLSEDEILKLFSEDKGRDKRTLSAIRETHHILSKKMIEAAIVSSESFVVPGMNFVLKVNNDEEKKVIKAIALVCGGHCGEFPGEGVELQHTINGKSVNLKLSTYLLRIGDCLDATRNRVPERLKGCLGRMSPQDELHMR